MLSTTRVQCTIQNTVESAECTVTLDSICSTSEDQANITANKQKNNPDPTTKTNPGEISGSSDQRREEVKRFNPSTPERTDVRGFVFLWMGMGANNGGGMIW